MISSVGSPSFGINGIGGLKPRTGNPVDFSVDPVSAGNTRRTSFGELLADSIGEVNSLQQNADTAVETLMTGGDIGTAEVLTAVQKADIAFKLMMQIRNKLVAAFQEIQNIRV
ncbi:MAG: flagellar hook-basal body complex protein FliE [Planctomycetaceae bacterium]|nr:flagellar hook-basal body complex protein FliE [Planctomycetaceae bacterium]